MKYKSQTSTLYPRGFSNFKLSSPELISQTSKTVINNLNVNEDGGNGLNATEVDREPSKHVFQADIDHGIIEPSNKTELKVKFSPRHIKTYEAHLR